MSTVNGNDVIYDIATETPNGAVAGSKLRQEILNTVTITTPLESVSVDNDADCIVRFTAPPPAPEVTILDGVLAAHDGIEPTATFKFKEENIAQSNATALWQTALTYDPPELQEGQYIISWQCELRVVPVGALDSAASLRVQVAGVNKHLGHWPFEDWTTVSGYERQRFLAGERPNLMVEFRQDPQVGGDDTIEIRRVKIGLARLNEV